MKIILVPLRIDLLKALNVDELEIALFYFPEDRSTSEILNSYVHHTEYNDTYASEVSDEDRDEDTIKCIIECNEQNEDLIIATHEQQFSRVENLIKENIYFGYDLEIINSPKNKESMDHNTAIHQYVERGEQSYFSVQSFFTYVTQLLYEKHTEKTDLVVANLN